MLCHLCLYILHILHILDYHTYCARGWGNARGDAEGGAKGTRRGTREWGERARGRGGGRARGHGGGRARGRGGGRAPGIFPIAGFKFLLPPARWASTTIRVCPPPGPARPPRSESPRRVRPHLNSDSESQRFPPAAGRREQSLGVRPTVGGRWGLGLRPST